MYSVTVGSINFKEDTMEELKAHIFRSFERDWPNWRANSDYIFYKKNFFDKEWPKEEAMEKFFTLEYGGWANSGFWIDIKAILTFYIKYGDKKEARNLFNMED